MFYRYIITIVAICTMPIALLSQNESERVKVQKHLINAEQLPYELLKDGDAAREVLVVVKENTKNPDHKIRRRSYSLALQVGLRCDEPDLKTEVLDVLIDASIDEDHSIRESLHEAYALFPKFLFSQAFKIKVITYLQDDRYANITHVLLAGYLDLDESRGRLKTLVNKSDDLIFSRQISYTSPFKSMKFSSHLALARMGDEESIDHVMSTLQSTNEREVVIHYLGLIAYIKQPRSLEYLIRILNTDKSIGGGDVFEESYGGRVLNYLIPMVDGLPVEENKSMLYGIDQVEKARTFVNSNRSSITINRAVW